MAVNGSGNSTASNAAEAARRAAEAAAKAAAEAARKAAETAAKAAANTVKHATPGASGFDAPKVDARKPRLDAGTAPATSLLNEDTQDGSVNCLDRAADWVETASPQLRARSELVFLKDARPGAEGQTGHVVVRQGERVFDPASQKSYDSLADYQRAQPQYQQVGSLPATQAARIFSTPPGSPERQAALAQAKVSPSLQRMLVADAPVEGANVSATAATESRELNPESVAQAEACYAQLQQAHYLGQPYLAAEMLQQHSNDPDFQAAFIGLMAEGGSDSVLQNVVTGMEGLFINTNGEFRGTEEQRQALTKGLQAALDAGTLTQADLQAMSQASPYVWEPVLAALDVTPAQRPEGADAALAEVEGATSGYEDALEAAREKDEWLGQQLAGLGDTLTPEQKQAYIEAFRNDPENKGVYDTLEAAGAKLAQAVKDNAAVLEAAAYANPEQDGAVLRKGLELLAASPHAAVAVELGARYLADPSSPMGQVAAGWGEDFSKKILETGVPNAASQLLATQDPDSALAQLEVLLDPLKKAGGAGASAFSDIKDGLEAIKLARAGNFDRLQQLAGKWDKASPLLKGLTAAGIAFGAVGAIQAGREGDFLGVVKNLASAGESGARLTASVLQSMSIAGDVAQGASFAAKLAPALGLVANAASLGLHVNQFVQDNNPGYLIAALGDAVSALGSAIELTPGAPAGLLINGIGAAITVIGELTAGFIEAGKLDDAREKYLEAIGIDPALSQTLRDADTERIQELTQELGIPPEDVQELAQQFPWLLTEGTNNGLYLDPTVKMLQAYGIKGEEAYALLSTMGAGNEDPSNSTFVVLMNLAREASWAQTPEDFDRILNDLKQSLPEHASTLDALLQAGQEHRAG
ncbi:hypothetical protein [Corallococcus carmarthensis]|uniref:Uncharacterized protein n=1 Tax=Corallococcus carmarthensis TaxID=2316728 RepID=A0A3A8JYD2_9BACT|nr:hypothetical protein [Corallococcus carmarthensis]RKG94613.1 hypothetical protein D7X32_41660 [Corallococcus carmarthensis]